MKEKLKFTMLTVLLAFLFLGCNSNNQPIRLATYTYSTNDRLENMQLLAQELETRLGCNVETTSYPNVESFREINWKQNRHQRKS